MRVLSFAFILSSLLVTAGCDADASDRELLAGGTMSDLTPAERELVQLQRAQLRAADEVEEASPAPAPAPTPRARRTQAPRTVQRTASYDPAPVYTPRPQVVKQTHIKRDAAIGAGVGAAVGAIAHDRNRWKGALVGGIIGGAAGAVVGATIDKSERVVYR